MPRPKHIDRPIRKEFNIPKSVYDKLMTELYSDIEGRVPYAAPSHLITELITKWLEGRGITV